MPADWTATPISGVLRRKTDFRSDGRGSFGELWRDSWTRGLGLHVAQVNLSRSRAGALRGLHFHQRQTDVWLFLEGTARVGLVDLRPRLAGTGDVTSWSGLVEPGDCLAIPIGVAHGFHAIEDVSLLYLVTNEYDGTDEHGFAWDDPTAAVDWQLSAPPILSDRDASAPTLADAVASVQ